MIPVKLSLRNFMPFRENVPPIDFSGIRLACLCGDNGAGKSALIDAMTWALWGRARSNSDDALIHLGRTEVEVEFEFKVGQEHYRALRKHSRGKPGRSGQSSLDLFLSTPEGFKTVSGDTMRQTQQKLIGILRMDYDTFINSAFLLQGRADEFTTNTPANRKRILGEILGLSHYDEMEDRAKEHAKAKEGEEQLLNSRIEAIDRELARRPECQVELERARAASETLETQVKAQETALGGLREARKALELEQAQLAELERRTAQARAALTKLDVQVPLMKHRLQEYQAVLAQSAAIEQGHAELIAARDQDQKLNSALGELHRLTQRKSQVEKSIEAARSRLVTEQSLLQKAVKDTEQKVALIPGLERELSLARDEIAALAKQEEALAGERKRGEELSNRIHLLESTNKQLRDDMNGLKPKVDLLAQGGARCPLCDTELGELEKANIKSKYEVEGRAKADQYRANQAEIKQRNDELQSLKTQLARLEAEWKKAGARSQGRIATLEKGLEDARRAEGEVTQGRKLLEEVERRLASADYAPAEHEALKQVLQQEAALAYDGTKHEQVRLRLNELARFEESHRRLEEARRLADPEKERLVQAEEQASVWRDNLKVDEDTRLRLARDLAALPDVLARLAAAEKSLSGLVAEKDRARQALGAAQEKLARCDLLEQDRTAKEAERVNVVKERAVYEELARAFGKKGIQALLIEAALPEIEEEATRLLGRMTENRMHLKLESQRQTQKGQPVETLDIRISDELGTRDYEMYSGGEAFRINFALRVALARLLARRAGAPLPTLVIDEGFGTQDRTALERVREAIDSIKDDFEMILVITHIEELKDAFPVRIEVTKTAEGSTVAVY